MTRIATGLLLAFFIVGKAPLDGSAYAAPPTDPAKIELLTQEGTKLKLADLKGTHWLVSFVFTRCPMPEACPLTLKKNKDVYREVKKDRSAPPLKFLIVTLDPSFDTPVVLKKFMADQGLDPKAFTLATGTPDAVEKFAAGLANVVAFPADGSLSHNVKTILLDPQLKEIVQLKDNEWKADDVLKALKKGVS